MSHDLLRLAHEYLEQLRLFRSVVSADDQCNCSRISVATRS